jgi:hypothetical protein
VLDSRFVKRYAENLVDLKDREVPIKCNEIFDFVKGQLKNLDLAPPT